MRPVVVGVLALLAFFVAGPAGPAAAHTGLEGAVPADGARVATAPRAVVLTFTGDVAPGALVRLTSPAGAPRDVRPQVDGRRVTVPVPQAGPGTYRLGYRVVARDGHPVSGDLTYTVLPRGTSAPSATPATPPPSGAAQPTATPADRLAASSGASAAGATSGSAPGASGTGGLPALTVVWLGVGALALGGAAVALAARRTGG